MDIIGFDPAKYRLGKLCKRGHDWQETGKSLRYKYDNHCPQCNIIEQRERKPPKPRVWPSLEERFWSKVNKSGDCWDWQASKDSCGYGQFAVKRKSAYSHRVAWELTYGAIPEGLKILHRCDRPCCCNPSHLSLGTQADNIADMVAKNRRRTSPGESNGYSKLTEEQVREIKRLWNNGGITQAAIAKRFGVKGTTIKRITSGKGWKHVD